MDFFNFPAEEMEIASKPHAVYKTGGRNKVSFSVTIPIAFAKEMGIAGNKKSYVMIRLVKENDNKNKKAYCIIEKLE